MNAVEVSDLTFAYPDASATLRDIGFAVPEGSVFVVAGASGSGKTTLCHILSGVIPNAVKGSLLGRVSVMGTNPAAEPLSRTALLAGLVFQDVDSQIIATTVEDELGFALENLCVPPAEIRRRVEELAAQFGFTGMERLDPSRLSDGRKKLLAIASVLAPSPPVIILDEPLGGLDDQNRRIVLEAIMNLRDEGHTAIIVEHDLRPLVFADKWLILSKGSAAAFGSPDELLREEPYLRELGVWD